MAVRNLQAIQRQGRAIAEAKKNERDLRTEHFWNRVNKITDTHNDAIDCIDTIKALCDNGLRERLEEWMKGKLVSYSFSNNYFYYGCSCPRNETANIEYYPKENYVSFAWHGYGMFSSYQTNTQYGIDRLIESELEHKGFDDGLTKFSTCLKPFFDEFFSWVETL